MRNLKRVLSMALALVMVLGMMVIGTSAATFTDAEEITYQEAVDVMSAIGVIDGVEAADGTFAFNPTETLTREQGAKIICYMLMGKTNAEKLVGSGEFTDVAATRWSAGAIDYCASLGILDGNGDGTFDPTGKLTAVQFGKMLLCALGYDADVEGYTGKNWATNIASDMVDIGLDVYGVEMDAQLTREQAAEMALYALQSDMVKYATKGTSITVNGMNIVTGASEAESVYSDSIYNWNIYAGTANSDGDYTLQFAEKYFPALVLDYDQDGMGRPSCVWTYGLNEIGEYSYSATYTTVAKAKLPNLTAPTAADVIDTISKKLDDTVAAVYVNGVLTGDSTTAIEIGSDVEIFLRWDGKVAYVIVTDYSATTVLANTATKTDKGVDYISINGVTPGYINAALVTGETDLAKFDVVLYYKDADGVYTIEKAESVTGTVSGIHSKNGLEVGESYYLASANAVPNTVTQSTWADFTNTYKFYLDHAGRYVKATQISDDLTDNYVVVTDVAWVQTQGIEGGYYLEARIVKADGSSEIVKIASVDGIKPVATTGKPGKDLVYWNGSAIGTTIVTDTATAGYFYYEPVGTQGVAGFELIGTAFGVAADGSNLTTPSSNALTVNAGHYMNVASQTFITKGAIYSYDLDRNGNYELFSDVVGTDKALANIDDSIKDTGDTANIGAPTNDSTVFVYATKAGANVKYTVYTGYANAPKATGIAQVANTIVVGRDGFAKLVYVDVTGAGAAVVGTFDADFVFVADNAKLTKKIGNNTVYTYDGLIINGVEGSMTLTNSSLSKGGMYVVTASNATTGAKTLTAIGSTSGVVVGNAAQTGISANGGYAIEIAGTTYNYTDDTVVYFINEDYESIQIAADAIALDATDVVYIVVDQLVATKAVKMFVVEMTNEPTALNVVTTEDTFYDYTNDGVSNANEDLIEGKVGVTGLTLGSSTIDVTVTPAANVSYTYTIKGNSNAAVATTDEAYTTVAQVVDGEGNITVTADTAVNITVTATDDFSGLQYVYVYTVAVNPS